MIRQLTGRLVLAPGLPQCLQSTGSVRSDIALHRRTRDSQDSRSLFALRTTGMSFHKLDKAKDKNFWSVRVSKDIRLIVHKTAGSLLLCYVDHHGKAYD